MSAGAPEFKRLARRRWEAKARTGPFGWVVAYGRSKRQARRRLQRLRP